jgi:hypothetical protein
MPVFPNVHPAINISELSPEDRQLFITLVEYLLEDNTWMLPEEAQLYAYQQICFRNLEQLG